MPTADEEEDSGRTVRFGDRCPMEARDWGDFRRSLGLRFKSTATTGHCWVASKRGLSLPARLKNINFKNVDT